ncbi:MAG: BMP family ABC transporter substrate-binding protein [Alphaproteobacteria bacterium]|nr:BMP family ABC transporter substrate-binding protein [Alphaproteobacteria bacterium]
MKRRTFTKLLGAGVVAGAAPAILRQAQAAGALNAAFIYVGPVSDFGYSYQHDQGRKDVEKAFGDKVKTIFVENVPEGPDCGRVLTELANKGNNIIFATSFGFMNPTVQVAAKYPKIYFEHATGYKRAKNLATYNIRFYEGRYIQGVIAGKLSKTGTVGYICSVPIPEVVMGLNAFIQGMHSVNPQGRIKMVWINEWYNPGKEGDAAKALLDQGADILAQHTDSAAPLQVAEQRGKLGFGQASDMMKLAPKAQLTASIDNWGPYYIDRVKLAMDGKWTSTDVWGGLAADMLRMAPYANMPSEVIGLAKQTENDIAVGKIVIFKGPIKDQSGAIKVAAGQTLDDKAISGMNWLAQGIEGQLPK